MYIEHQSALAGDSLPRLEPALESLLSQSMLRADVMDQLYHCGTRFLHEPAMPCGVFHLISHGQCEVECEVADGKVVLGAGDLILFPHGAPHRLRAALGSDMRTTAMVCGELHFSSHTEHPLRHALPACIVIRAAQASTLFRSVSSMLIEVISAGLPGRQLLLNKLADTLFTLTICDYANRHADRRGLFTALTDTRICKVLQAVHERPGYPWTMQAMASLACMSRSAFAERFVQLMNMPPMQYVTQWRVSVAERLLLDRQLSVASIADRLGYRSEAAFRRLFKRVSGVCPGRLRSAEPALRTA